MKKRKRREHAQIVRDRRVISVLYLQGMLQADIADNLNLSPATICRDLQALQAEWLERTRENFDALKAQEIANVDQLERTYYDAWLRSCEDAETVQQVGDKEGVDKITKTRKEQIGDPRFLSGVQWCIERRCKILGIDAPTKRDITTGGEPLILRVSGFDKV